MVLYSLTFAGSRENVMKTRGESGGFQHFPGDLRILTNDKIMVDRYYCIQSTKPLQKRRKCLRTLFHNLITFLYAYKHKYA